MKPELNRRSIALFAILLVSLIAGCSRAPEETMWRVYALEYGLSEGYPRSSMVRDAPPEEKSTMSWQAWLIRNDRRTILVDTGFGQESVARKWKLTYFQKVPELLAHLSIPPEDITDVVLTHLHWDHAGNMAPYNNATYWVQKSEMEWARKMVNEKRPRRGGVRLEDVRMLAALERAGRVRYVSGDWEIAPGVAVHEGGKHTGGTQWVHITRQPGEHIALASDNAYVYENIDRLVATGACISPKENVKALEMMVEKVPTRKFIIPGHNHMVMTRFPLVFAHIVEIK